MKRYLFLFLFLFLHNNVEATQSYSKEGNTMQNNANTTFSGNEHCWKMEEIGIADQRGNVSPARLYTVTERLKEVYRPSVLAELPHQIIFEKGKAHLFRFNTETKHFFKVNGKIYHPSFSGWGIAFYPSIETDKINEKDLKDATTVAEKIRDCLKKQEAPLTAAIRPGDFPRNFFSWGELNARPFSFEAVKIMGLAGDKDLIRVDIENVAYPQIISLWIDFGKNSVVRVAYTKFPLFELFNPIESLPEEVAQVDEAKQRHGEFNTLSWVNRRISMAAGVSAKKSSLVYSALFTSEKSAFEKIINSGRTPPPFRSDFPNKYINIALDENSRKVFWCGVASGKLLAFLDIDGKYHALFMTKTDIPDGKKINFHLSQGGLLDAPLFNKEFRPSNAMLTLAGLSEFICPSSSVRRKRAIDISDQCAESIEHLLRRGTIGNFFVDIKQIDKWTYQLEMKIAKHTIATDKGRAELNGKKSFLLNLRADKIYTYPDGE